MINDSLIVFSLFMGFVDKIKMIDYIRPCPQNTETRSAELNT